MGVLLSGQKKAGREVFGAARDGGNPRRAGNLAISPFTAELDAGFEQVTSMSGGLNAWGAAGYPLESQIP